MAMNDSLLGPEENIKAIEIEMIYYYVLKVHHTW